MLSGKVLVIIAGLLAAAATVKLATAADELPQIERTLVLKARAETWSQKVCLGELVEETWVQSRCAIDQSACCRWNMGGELTKTFKRAELEREMAKISFTGTALSLKGAEEISVTQTKRELTVAEIKTRLLAVAAAKVSDDAQNIGIASLKIPAPIYVALNDQADWDVTLPEQITEHMNAKISSTSDSGQYFGWVQVVLRQDSEVYVAKKTIHPNDTVRAEDFDLKRTNVLDARAMGKVYYRKGQFPDGQRARMTISVGAPLLADQIERMPSVRLGDMVTLILRSDNLRISTRGVVQGTAAVGDMVSVTLQRYNRTFRGRLMEGKLVEVWL